MPKNLAITQFATRLSTYTSTDPIIVNLFTDKNEQTNVFNQLNGEIEDIIANYKDYIRNGSDPKYVFTRFKEFLRVYNVFVFTTIKTNLINWVIYTINDNPQPRKYTPIVNTWKGFIDLISVPFLPTEGDTPTELNEFQIETISNFKTLINKENGISDDKDVQNNTFYPKLLDRLNAVIEKTLNDLKGIDTRRRSSRNKTKGGKKNDPEIIPKQERDNADHNVKCMLILLLPIADEFVNVFQTSYDQYILDKPSSELYTLRNIDPTMLLNPTWLPFYNYFSTRKYTPPIQEISYIKQGGAKYAVASVIWLNDIVNHPIYRELLTTFYEKSLEKQNNRPKIKTQLNERLAMFRGLIQRNQTAGNKKVNLFTKLFETLLENVNITPKGVGKNIKTPSEQIESLVSQFTNSTNPDTRALSGDISKVVSAVTNPKDAAKRDSVIKMATSISKIIAINNRFQKRNELTVVGWVSMIDNIVSAYIEYSLYNESADKGMQINLKDEARTFTELYNQALFIKALRLLDDFLHSRISRFDMNEKNLDGSPKPKLELDIIRIIKTNFPYYIKLNDDIVKSLRNVLDPTRRSSNPDLQKFLKNMFIPNNQAKPSTGDMSDEKYAILEIYNKYIANTRKHIYHGFTEKLMYTGVSTVVESDGSSSSKTITPNTPETPGVVPKPVGGDDQQPAASSYREIPEIYVYVNVVQKEDYEGNENRMCIMNDDHIANNLKRVLFANTMMDDSFPEVNPYRVYRFLKGSETKTPFNVDNANKSNPQTPTQNVTQGGTKRVARNTHRYLSKRFPVKNTRKYRKK